MKKEEIFEMTKHIDDKYVLEAAEPVKNIKVKKRIITFAIAAVVAAALSAGAFAAYKAFNKKSAGKFYDSSAVDTMEKRGFGVGKSVENGHFRVTLETAVKDDVDLRAVFTLETLDNDAKEFMQKYNGFANPEFRLSYSDTGEEIKEPVSVYNPTQDTENGANADITNVSLAMNLNYKWQKCDPERPLTVKLGNVTQDEGYYGEEAIKPDAKYDKLFEGLEFKLEGFEKVKSADFYNEDGVKMYVSELTIAVPPTYMQSGEVIEFGGEGKQPDEIDIHFKDGTVKNTYADHLMSRVSQYGDEDSETEVFSMRKFIDVDNIDFIEFDGKTYKRK